MQTLIDEVTVLIIDDSNYDRAHYRKLLERSKDLSVVCVEATTAEEGFQLCCARAPDCVLLDCHLPDGDGLEVLQRINDEILEPMPVIMLTGDSDAETAVRAIKGGARDYLIKGSISGSALTRAVREAIEYIALMRVIKTQTEELEQRNRDLEEFAHVASHDLQEPLRKILRFGELLREDAGDDLSKECSEHLDRISNASVRMKTLIEDILSLSQTGIRGIRRESVDLDECIDNALEALSLRIEESNAEITRDDLPTAWCDPSLVTQLYQNLVNNALKFSNGEKPQVHITCDSSGPSVILGVRDNGIGIKEEHFSQIFSPFKRLHSRADYEGSGIGLSICRKVIECHHGKIWVESVPGQGAHFRFMLPQPTKSRFGALPSSATVR